MPSRFLTKKCPWLLLSVVWLLTGMTRPAYARGPDGQASDACMDDAHCKELADRGQAAYQQQLYDAAVVSLREAYALHPVTWLLFNLGRSYQKLGKTDEALAAYRTFLQQSRAQDEALEREKARVVVEQIERDRSAQAADLNPAASTEKKPVYKKWWFWTILGGIAAAGVAVGVGVGVGSKASQMDLPADVQLLMFNF